MKIKHIMHLEVCHEIYNTHFTSWQIYCVETFAGCHKSAIIVTYGTLQDLFGCWQYFLQPFWLHFPHQLHFKHLSPLAHSLFLTWVASPRFPRLSLIEVSPGIPIRLYAIETPSPALEMSSLSTYGGPCSPCWGHQVYWSLSVLFSPQLWDYSQHLLLALLYASTLPSSDLPMKTPSQNIMLYTLPHSKKVDFASLCPLQAVLNS